MYMQAQTERQTHTHTDTQTHTYRQTHTHTDRQTNLVTLIKWSAWPEWGLILIISSSNGVTLTSLAPELWPFSCIRNASCLLSPTSNNCRASNAALDMFSCDEVTENIMKIWSLEAQIIWIPSFIPLPAYQLCTIYCTKYSLDCTK